MVGEHAIDTPTDQLAGSTDGVNGPGMDPQAGCVRADEALAGHELMPRVPGVSAKADRALQRMIGMMPADEGGRQTDRA